MNRKQRAAMLRDCERKQNRLAELRTRYSQPKPRPPAPPEVPEKPLNYHAYILSPHWRAFKIIVFARKGTKCEICGETRSLNVHHRTYKNLFRETLDDVEVLCRDCHAKLHGKLITETRKP